MFSLFLHILAMQSTHAKYETEEEKEIMCYCTAEL